jgi:hypothetical protein
MSIWGRNKIIGLDVDEGLSFACELSGDPSRVTLTRYVKGGSLAELAANPLLKDAQVIISIPTQIVLFRNFYTPAALAKSKGKNKFKEIAAFLVRQNLPFKLEECYWDAFIWGNNLHFIAAKKEMAEKYISQIEDAGLTCLSATVSPAALYNVLIYNYPGKQNARCAILNIRHTASDLLMYEPHKMWMYPLSVGKKDLKGSPESTERFSLEVQRAFNAHYLQNPPAAAQAAGYFYLSGSEASQVLTESLKKALPDFEIAPLEPLAKVASKGTAENQSLMALAIGLGLSSFDIPGGLRTNIIKDKVAKGRLDATFAMLKTAAAAFISLVAALLLIRDLMLFNNFNKQARLNRDTQDQVSSTLPQVKNLKQEKEKLGTVVNFLEAKLNQQMQYLKVLALISDCKSASVLIKDFSAQNKESLLEVSLSGTSTTYEEINNFLANLKKNPDIRDVKVLASSFPEAGAETKAIDFKLRFDVKL